MIKRKVNLFVKRNKPFIGEVILYTRSKFSDVTVFQGDRGEPFPDEANDDCDIVISYLSAWIFPGDVLSRSGVAINFHPAPPEYPGIGCFNFALYDDVDRYGVTCHYMAEKVDTGKIIEVARFPVTPDESVLTLSVKSYAYMFMLYTKMVDILASGESLPLTGECWTRRPFLRRELDALCRIPENADLNEIKRIVRATDYPGMPGAFYIDNGEAYAISRRRENNA